MLLKKKKNIIFVLIIFITIVTTIIVLSSKLRREIYSVDSRVENIEKEKKKDDNFSYKTIGWLKVQGTNIDAPIITYLTDDDSILVSKENYLWNLNTKEKLYNKVNILGHNILNLSVHPESGKQYFSRFDDLMSFVYYDFVKENKYIQYTVDGHDYIYKIFAVGFDYQYNLNLNNNDNYQKEQLQKYINKMKKKSIYNFRAKVNKNDKIITLITCTRMFGVEDEREFVVSARLVRKNERLTNYKVQKTKKYKEVEKKLKGDVKNEKA